MEFEKLCEKAQEGLWKQFFDEKKGILQNHKPVRT